MKRYFIREVGTNRYYENQYHSYSFTEKLECAKLFHNLSAAKSVCTRIKKDGKILKLLR